MQLFTSQGCSSCPPADALIEKIKNEYTQKNVFVLSYHVDYWDRLGWKDPFGKRAYTEMQYAYADKFRERRVYTPQIVVNGKEHFVGSNESLLRKKLRSFLKKKAENSIQLSTKVAENILEVTYNVTGEKAEKKLVLALVLEKETTQVKRGENAHHALTNSNIVIQQKEISIVSKGSGTSSISVPTTTKKYKIIAFVQDKNLNITGAQQIAI
jgi:hypothetical protein